MRPRLLALALCLTACASHPPRLVLPESDLPLADRPPPPPAPPSTGPFESTRSREVKLAVVVAGRTVSLWSWCRVGVWTTLQSLRPEEFLVREAWGRLGSRPPRLLAQVTDQVVGGVVARLRPEFDGSLSFLIEVSTTELGETQVAGLFFGREVRLDSPRRHGYRFRGRARRGWQGLLARWTPGVVVRLQKSELPLDALYFRASGQGGLVTGERVEAEAFVEEWVPAAPIRVHADGIERADFRLKRVRKAAGFRPDGRGGYETYGASFDFSPPGRRRSR